MEGWAARYYRSLEALWIQITFDCNAVCLIPFLLCQHVLFLIYFGRKSILFLSELLASVKSLHLVVFSWSIFGGFGPKCVCIIGKERIAERINSMTDIGREEALLTLSELNLKNFTGIVCVHLMCRLLTSCVCLVKHSRAIQKSLLQTSLCLSVQIILLSLLPVFFNSASIHIFR